MTYDLNKSDLSRNSKQNTNKDHFEVTIAFLTYVFRSLSCIQIAMKKLLR